MWPLISGMNNTSPRIELPISNYTYFNGSMKLITGHLAATSGWQGPVYPNSTSPANPMSKIVLNCTQGCLFDVDADPLEYHDLAAEQPETLARMQARFNYLKQFYYNNNELGTNSCPPNITGECACWMAENRYGGFLGPYQEL